MQRGLFASRRSAPAKAAMQALGRLPVGTMNKTEEAYAAHLRKRELVGEVLWWRFEPMKLRLATLTTYSADFLVMVADRGLELHEVKGGLWQDDARVKIKVAAEQFPIFRFIAVRALPQRNGGGWAIEEF